MSVERPLILQELVLRPSGEWNPRHKGWVIARVAEGAGYWMQGGNARELNAGDGFVAAFNANAQVRASQLGTLKLQYFTVQPQYLNGLLTVMEWQRLETPPEQPYNLTFSADDLLGQRFTRLVNQSHAEELPARIALLQLWATAVSAVLSTSAPAFSNGNKLRERFRHLLGQMPEKELAGHSLAELAGQLHCSERHFSRLFREEFGVPLRTRQIELRLQHARQLLADSDDKIINVAYESGYRHLGLFNAMFKKRFGLTPGEWRRQNARSAPPASSRQNLPRWASGIGILLMVLGLFFSTAAAAQTNSPKTDANKEAELLAALNQKMAELDAQERMARIHVVPVSTNSGPRFRVDRFEVGGNTLLAPGTIGDIFSNVPAAFGTNVTIDAILAAVGDLQAAYRARGFMTVVVGMPRQTLTNGTVKVNVVEGRLAVINVGGENWHHYFSSNNVLRALPSLRTNILLNAKIFQRELDAANMNRDRQIYPVIGPGPEPGTSELTLNVKDRLPWHARLEVNNQATPATPDMRAAFSSQYDNLWGLEHQIGLQYNFSFDQFKGGNNYSSLPFDTPQVANYSAYYRLPLGGYSSVQEEVNAHPGSFGYNEATHQFNLPPQAGRPELTFFGSRSTADTGVQYGPSTLVTSPTNQLLKIYSQDSGDNVTLNENLGWRLTVPLPEVAKVSSSFSLGLDFKRFRLVSYNTNNFPYFFTYTNQGTGPVTITTNVASAQPVRFQAVDYLPINVGMNGSAPDKFGTTFFNANASFNPLAVLSKNADFANAAYSLKSRANYVVVQAGADRAQTIHKDWTVKLHADGQWADSPLLGNEQYSMGGVAGVRGYADGEAYGDTGWRVMIEPQMPALDIGMFGNNGSEEPCTLRGSVFVDYGELYLLDPPAGAQGRRQFWGAGWGVTANIGSHLDARLTMAFPLIATPQTRAGEVHVYFGVGAHF